MNKTNKFLKGDYVLVEVGSPLIGIDVWVGHITHVGKTCYAVKSLSHNANFVTKLPFLFDKMLVKIEPVNLENTIKAVKLLYNKLT
jgi:hypothetical protein